VDAAGDGPQAQAPLAGDWFLFGFEDPVCVHLDVQPDAGADGGAYEITGRGCDICSDLYQAAPGEEGYCGAVHGQGAGAKLEFAFTFTYGLPPGGETFTASVQGSRDGTRMAGPLTSMVAGDPYPPSTTLPFGWTRLADIGVVDGAFDRETIPPADLGPFTDGGEREFAFVLQGDAPVGGLVPGRTYFEKLDAYSLVRLTGDLGAYWNPDFHWDAATSTYTAGPVPETLPGFPVKLELQFSPDFLVHEAVVTMADGTTGRLMGVDPWAAQP
jgi:hypothetical protein